jgi:phosphate transport system ATP-binding protein
MRMLVDDVSLDIGGRRILDRVGFEVDRPGLHAILGASGCGKSTLLALITRQLHASRQPHGRGWPGRPARPGGLVLSGRIEVDGRAIEHWDEVALRRSVGMVLQQPVMLAGSVRDNLLRPQRAVIPGRSEAGRVADAHLALRDASLHDEVRMEQPAAALSGGQQQRLSIARALMLFPRALLLDEPTSALDDRAGRAVHDTLRRLAARIPVVLVTHDTRLARLADRVIFLAAESTASGARVLFDGLPRELLGPGAPRPLKEFMSAFGVER